MSEEKEILVVASKVKKYIKEKAGMNTSDKIMDFLSDIVRKECDQAIERAKADGRKTVMDRDMTPTA
jgi:histone H3/H4